MVSAKLRSRLGLADYHFVIPSGVEGSYCHQKKNMRCLPASAGLDMTKTELVAIIVVSVKRQGV
jgi:hypothetical protein